MTYNVRDVFPGALPPRQTDLATLVASLDSSADVPVVYSFGGGAPTSITFGGKVWMEQVFSGPIGITRKTTTPFSSRLFVEFFPYEWNPNNPNYSGG